MGWEAGQIGLMSPDESDSKTYQPSSSVHALNRRHSSGASRDILVCSTGDLNFEQGRCNNLRILEANRWDTGMVFSTESCGLQRKVILPTLEQKGRDSYLCLRIESALETGWCVCV